MFGSTWIDGDGAKVVVGGNTAVEAGSEGKVVVGGTVVAIGGGDVDVVGSDVDVVGTADLEVVVVTGPFTVVFEPHAVSPRTTSATPRAARKSML